MFIVTVNFIVVPEHREAFAAAMDEQAKNSLNLEADCHVFDVGVDTDDDCSFFLYEKYTDSAAFDTHLESSHFLNFNARVTPWITSKSVATWNERAS